MVNNKIFSYIIESGKQKSEKKIKDLKYRKKNTKNKALPFSNYSTDKKSLAPQKKLIFSYIESVKTYLVEL